MVAPLRLIVTGLVTVRVPPHWDAELLSTVRPAGKVSLKPTPVSACAEFGLVMVKLSEVVPFSGMVDAPNAILIVGGDATEMEARAVLPVPPLFEVTAPVMLFCGPAAVAVTLTMTVHVSAAAMVPPEKVSVVSFVFGSKVPPQLVLAPVVAATFKPEGRASVKPTPVS
jgi:hypothetical protein